MDQHDHNATDDGELQARWATEMTERDERPGRDERPLRPETLDAFFGLPTFNS
ncbi:hypothetical protein [Kitasatospora sp. NPDC007106]|uniref:hypothetical protein n=1 Tax=Kitasatospora sp. NPDC007106 TaxID=3156914 RepID=UPI003404C6EF